MTSRSKLVKSRQLPDTFFLGRATEPSPASRHASFASVRGMRPRLDRRVNLPYPSAFFHELTLSGQDLGISAQGR